MIVKIAEGAVRRHIGHLAINIDIVSEGIVTVQVIASGSIFIDEKDQTIIIPVAYRRFFVNIHQPVVCNFCQDVNIVFIPGHFEAPVKISSIGLFALPSLVDKKPFSPLP